MHGNARKTLRHCERPEIYVTTIAAESILARSAGPVVLLAALAEPALASFEITIRAQMTRAACLGLR